VDNAFPVLGPQSFIGPSRSRWNMLQPFSRGSFICIPCFAHHITHLHTCNCQYNMRENYLMSLIILSYCVYMHVDTARVGRACVRPLCRALYRPAILAGFTIHPSSISSNLIHPISFLCTPERLCIFSPLFSFFLLLLPLLLL
jgi:hypothetical protein